MAGFRQQRTRNNRGLVQLPNQRPIGDVSWIVTQTGGAQLTIVPTVPVAGAQLVALPKISAGAATNFPTAAALAGTALVLTYSAALTAPFAVRVPALDPAYRTLPGGFLAQGTASIVAAPPVYNAENQVSWSVDRSSAPTFVITPDVDPLTVFVTPSMITGQMTGNPCTSLSVDSGSITCTVPGEDSGDGANIVIADAALFSTGDAPNVLTPGLAGMFATFTAAEKKRVASKLIAAAGRKRRAATAQRKSG